MQEFFQSLVIGAIQGITEFLPISSSGHLVLVPYLFGWDYQGLSFDVALHFGTALAVIAYFRRDWIKIIAKGLRLKAEGNSNLASGLRPPALGFSASSPRPPALGKNLLWQILIASIPAAIAGILINDYVESTLHSPLLLAANLIIFGWLLWYADKRAAFGLWPSAFAHSISTQGDLSLSKIGLRHALFIGLAQSLALVPGVSRSGITITAARSLGLNREAATRFSFLLGTPAIVGAFLYKFKDIDIALINLPFIVATLAAMVFGFLAIKYLLQYLRKSDFSVFLWYRVALAIIVLFGGK